MCQQLRDGPAGPHRLTGEHGATPSRDGRGSRVGVATDRRAPAHGAAPSSGRRGSPRAPVVPRQRRRPIWPRNGAGRAASSVLNVSKTTSTLAKQLANTAPRGPKQLPKQPSVVGGSFGWYFIVRGVKCPNPNLRGFSLHNELVLLNMVRSSVGTIYCSLSEVGEENYRY